MMPDKRIQTNKGFSLIETLVAIGILSLSITASFTAVQSGLQTSTGARDQVTAFYLTQEGMEYIKNIRDENALDSINGGSKTWLSGMASGAGDPCYFGKVCQIDSTAKTITSCGSASITTSAPNLCAKLRQDVTTGLFGYTSAWPESKFKREIQFQSVSADEVNVIISMSWTDRGSTKFFQVSETLLNRQ